MDEKLTVIYNDTCPICAREVASYKRATGRLGLDIAYAGLSQSALSRFGLTQDEAARRFHVLKDGTLVSGVDAFALLWDEMPRLRWLARFVRLPIIAPLARVVYDRALAPLLFAFHKRRERKGRLRHIG
ncbi:thiol-disulfide oxidoreductase DCC family protein [Cognatishimia sp. F0-27]|uniref:thiol-disulfide oxidoreductase DCC family protein n=1 Tax=Cognatishimia sp. F0-27 TaxID=2816855 RepID=UPI001D0C3F8A|nr:DUF393 domain-containing protein [Cognatishimia sp. F0-27]MCC1493692.1 DUF393 domain-containing protein [Cognatishimia sp. F0-27]